MAELLNGRYRLGDVIGSGGMGAVHRADDTRLNRVVAVKVLRGGALADDVARSRMRSEAQLAASIHHPGVAQVYDYDDASSSHGGMSFIAMQYVEGQSLSQLLRENGSMPVDQVMSVVQQVAEALAAAHRVGVVHRDLKPANIMLTPAGRTVLVDFGIAHSGTSDPLTETGALLGTVDYLSPEQAAGRPASPQSDIYSLGIVAHHCLTGVSPFRRETSIATALAHLHEDLPPLDPSVPPEVQELVSRLAAKSPLDRPADAFAVATAAAAIGAAPAVDVPPTVEMQLPRGADPEQTAAIQQTTAIPVAAASPTVAEPAVSRPRSRRSMALFSGVGAVAAVLLFLGIGQMQSDDPASVPDVVGMDVSEATKALRADDMTVNRETVDAPGTPAGQVVRQSPDPGADRPDDGSVDVAIASGTVDLSTVDVVGSTYAEAAKALEALGLVVAREDVPRSSGVGDVVAMDQSGRVPDGSTVTLSVAVAQAAPTTSSSGSSSSSTSGGKAGKGSTKSTGKGKGKNK